MFTHDKAGAMTKIEWANLGLESGETWNPIRARIASDGLRETGCPHTRMTMTSLLTLEDENENHQSNM